LNVFYPTDIVSVHFVLLPHEMGLINVQGAPGEGSKKLFSVYLI